MAILAKLGRFRGLVLALPLVPVFFVVDHVDAGGVPAALGCSGAANVAPPPGVQVFDPNGKLQVATDGFFLLTTSGYLSDPVQAVTVTAKTGEGEEVPGKLTSLYPGMLGWEANEPLVTGSKLKVTAEVQGAPAIASETFEVAGAPTPLTEQVLSFREWVDFRHGVGESVTCRGSSSSCSQQNYTFPGSEEQLKAARLEWTPPSDIQGYVVWQPRLELRSGPDEIGSSNGSYLFGAPSEPATLPLGTLVFPKDTTEYCAVLVVKDWRHGIEQRSQLCAKPTEPSSIDRDTPVESCQSLPSPATSDAAKVFCELHPTNAACSEPNPPHAGGSANGGTESPVTMPQTPQDAATDADSSPHTSSGCQLTPGLKRHTGSGALLAALALSALLRRRSSLSTLGTARRRGRAWKQVER